MSKEGASSQLRTSQIAMRVFGGILAGFFLVLGAAIWLLRDPPLTEDQYEAALARWRKAPPGDYDMSLSLTGRRRDSIEVRIRGGRPTYLSINGQRIEKSEALETWTVESQFTYIRDDLDNMSDSKLTLRAQFDEKYGLPIKYRRFQPSQGETGWSVENFKVLDDP